MSEEEDVAHGLDKPVSCPLRPVIIYLLVLGESAKTKTSQKNTNNTLEKTSQLVLNGFLN